MESLPPEVDGNVRGAREDGLTVGERVRQGRADFARFQQDPSQLARLPIGREEAQGRGLRAMQAAALALRVSPRFLAGLGRLLPGRRLSSAWDRFTASYAYWSGVRSAAGSENWQRLQRGVLILMYHAIGAPGEPASRYVLPVKRFERQMKWLKRRGYNVIGLDAYAELRAANRLPPPKSVVLTFDDGYLDNLTLARPVLERLGLPATVFLVSAVHERNTWTTSDGVAGRPLMSHDDAREALGGILTFGAHTRTHPRLPTIPLEAAEREITVSKDELEAALGVAVTTFAYPYGLVNSAVRDVVSGAGFAAACGVVPGRNRPSTDDFALRRVEILGTDGLLRFAATVWLGAMSMRRRRRR